MQASGFRRITNKKGQNCACLLKTGRLFLHRTNKSKTMNYDNELESLGYTYYEPASNEYHNIRKEINPVGALFFTLIGLFSIALLGVIFFTDKLSALFGN